MSKKPDSIAFDAELLSFEGGGHGIKVPQDILHALGGKSRIKVKALFDNEPYRGSIAPYGGMNFLGVLKSIREKIGKQAGDTIHVVLEEDVEERVVELPDDFGAALKKNPAAKKIYDGFSFTYQKAYVRWIESAKQAATRSSRVERAIELLKEGVKFNSSPPSAK